MEFEALRVAVAGSVLVADVPICCQLIFNLSYRRLTYTHGFPWL